MDIINSRVGNFTSSQNFRLMGAPKPRETYIQECNYERKLGRRLGSNSFTQATSWGNFCEVYVHNRVLPIEYSFKSKIVLDHPSIPFFKGSPDFTKTELVSDCKAPYTMKSFCQLIEHCQVLEVFKKEHDDYYWQLVSNSILTDKGKIELIVYCPYKSELLDMYQFLDSFDWIAAGYDAFEFKWISDAIMRDNGQLPYLIDDGNYKNLNKFVYDVKKEDQELLIAQILEVGKQLINIPQQA